MKQLAYCLFETPLGACGIAWTEPKASSLRAAPAVTLLQLPEADALATETTLMRRSRARRSATPPPAIAAVIRKVRAHLGGRPQDFRDVPLDLDAAPPFARRVYQAARKIPSGKTRTYGDLARLLRNPAAARAVGQAMARNPVPIIIPCHRVLAAGGRPGGFSAHGGRATKVRMLSLEGAQLDFHI